MVDQPRILFVEDDDSLASVYQLRMEAEGYNVKHVTDGEQALKAVAESKPDLILLDIMMPKLDGFDVLQTLSKNGSKDAIKVIVLSALGQPSDQDRARLLGADEYLIKSQASIADVMERIKFHLL